tara:strand:+ start:135 stop:401 length:267 start_codon:yes stop_codon:yes gene_type:complete
MAISTGHTAVLTTPSQIDGTSPNPSRIRIFNASNDKTVYIGNDGVSTSNGFGLVKLEQMDIVVNPGESLYCVAESTGAEIQWIRQTLY